MSMSPETLKQIAAWIAEVIPPSEKRKAKIIRKKDGELEVVSPL